MTTTAKRPSLGPVDRARFFGKRRELLTPVQRVIRDADQTLGNAGGLVDVAIDIARARLAGDEAKAAKALSTVRERRRPWVERIACELVDAATTGSTTREREDTARRVNALLDSMPDEESDLTPEPDDDEIVALTHHRDREAAS